MGKKKRQNQSSGNLVGGGGGGGDSSSDSDSSKSSAANLATGDASKTTCQHVKKSVDLAILRKNVKTNKDKNTHLTCSTCKDESEPCKSGWVCLRCGVLSCSDHRLAHFLVPRSDSHALACQANTDTDKPAPVAVWCFKCDKEVPIDSQKLVQSAAEFVKKQYNDTLSYGPIKHETDTKKMNGETSLAEDGLGLGLASGTKEVIKPLVKDPVSSLPKVRGLANLGNTCFFNSVLQCLAQTPGLTALLDEMDVPGEPFTIQLDGVTIDTRLEKVRGSVLSEQLSLVLRQVAGGGGGGSVNPRGLLSALTSRCRQFEGYDQHDAHELLRHLLDSVHSDDLKRYQKAILDHIGYKNNLDELDEEKKKFGKKLNQKVCDTIPIRPDHIFKGSLVSILQCTVCGHKSKREETFLDLSLPVLPEKAHHVKKKVSCSSPVEEKQTSEVVLSKHQLKKEKKNARKNRKHNKNTNKTDGENQGEPTIEEEDKKGDSADEDESDADVEDNEETDQGKAEAEAEVEVVESGYSSEKQASPAHTPPPPPPLPPIPLPAPDDDDATVRASGSGSPVEGGAASLDSGLLRLSLALPAPAPSPSRFKYSIEEGECSLQSCLRQFTSIEMLTANNKVGCDACTQAANKGVKEGGGSVKTVYQNSTKQLLICKLPPVVIFHLKRFEVQRFSSRKLSRPVQFPLVLDISQFCADPTEEPVLYSLYGVVEHSGTMQGGHYVAYVKVRGGEGGGSWYLVSDSFARPADERSVLNSQAYLLFYERIH